MTTYRTVVIGTLGSLNICRVHLCLELPDFTKMGGIEILKNWSAIFHVVLTLDRG